jgi:8-oxo-dGTP pyrophosphatase MutT (NUDIX family)
MIRRALPGEGQGRLALPGGYQMLGQTWQEAGAREVLEETGVAIEPASLQVVAVETTPDRRGKSSDSARQKPLAPRNARGLLRLLGAAHALRPVTPADDEEVLPASWLGEDPAFSLITTSLILWRLNRRDLGTGHRRSKEQSGPEDVNCGLRHVGFSPTG